MEELYLLLIFGFSIFTIFYLAELLGRVDSYVLFIWSGWAFVGVSIALVFFQDNNAGGFASLGLAFFVISEALILHRKNSNLQSIIYERYRLTLDIVDYHREVQKERTKIFNKQVLYYMTDDPSFDLEELSMCKQVGNDVFSRSKEKLDSRVDAIQASQTQEKQDSSIHIIIIIGILVATVIWGWG